MTDVLLIPSNTSTPQDWIRRFVWKIAIATLLLMAVGSATRVMNAGLACPDWPLCYGQLIPTKQMNLQVFLEWFHRLDAALIGVSTILLVILSWWWRSSLPPWLFWASLGSLGLVCSQGLLGALTVTELLRFDLVTAHLGTALLFFSSLLIIGTILSPLPKISPINSFLPMVSFIAAILIYVQSLLGGLVGSQWALHQCFGYNELCQIMNNHLLGVIPASLTTIATIVFTFKTPQLRTNSIIIASLLTLQILIGTATFKLHLQVETLTVLHQAIGACLLGILIINTVITLRLKKSASISASVA